MHSNVETESGLSLIKTAFQDALKWEGNKLEALPCIELVLELHPKNTGKKGRTCEDMCQFGDNLLFLFVFNQKQKKIDHKIDLTILFNLEIPWKIWTTKFWQ